MVIKLKLIIRKYFEMSSAYFFIQHAKRSELVSFNCFSSSGLSYYCIILSNSNNSNTNGSFIMTDSNLRNSSDSSRKQIFRDFFSFYHEIVCCVYSLESPHRGDSNENTQHTILRRKSKKKSLNYRHLLPDLVP